MPAPAPVIPGAPVVKSGEPINPLIPAVPVVPAVQLSMTQAELDAKILSESDKRVNQALETSKTKWETEHAALLITERAEAKRLALMSVEEREKEIEKQRVSQLDDRENKLNRRDIQIKAITKLDTSSLPVSFAELLLGDTEAETMINIDTFQKAWQKEIDAEVTKRLKGKTPEGGSIPGGGADMNALIRRSAGRR